MPSRVIHVASTPEENTPKMAYLEQDLEKGIVNTIFQPTGSITTKNFPKYKDKVTWISVVGRGVPDTVNIAGLKYLFNGRETKPRR